MTLQQIKDNAPDGATHYDIEFGDIFYKLKKSNWYVYAIGCSGWLVVENYSAFWSYNYFNIKPL